MNDDPRWTRALESLTTAFANIESLSGASDQPFGNSAILEVRNELAHMIRRVSNLALLHGVKPVDVEAARRKEDAN